MIRCPGCHTQNRDDALLCTMCKRVLRRATDPVPPPDGSVASHHTIDLPGAKAPPRALELADRPRRPSSRPPPPADSPGMNPTSARTISYRPPPPDTGAGPSFVERALDVLARPFDAILWFSVRAPDATLTQHIGDQVRVRFSALGRIGFLAHAWGAIALALPWLDPREADSWVGFAIVAGMVAIASGGRWWVSRSWAAGEDPSPIATLLSTVLPYAGVAVPAVIGIASLLGGLVRPETPGMPSLVGVGRTVAIAAIALYLLLFGAAFARDRVRSAREQRA